MGPFNLSKLTALTSYSFCTGAVSVVLDLDLPLISNQLFPKLQPPALPEPRLSTGFIHCFWQVAVPGPTRASTYCHLINLQPLHCSQNITTILTRLIFLSFHLLLSFPHFRNELAFLTLFTWWGDFYQSPR